MRAPLGLGLAVLAAVLACAAPAAAATGCSKAPRTGSREVRIHSGGRLRSAVVHIPAGTAAGRALPVVIVLHGAGSTGPKMESYTGMSAVADREGFMAVYPNAVVPHPFWNYYGSTTRPNDVRFVADLLDHLESSRCVDATRVYATGVSNGGGMTARLGCRLGARLAAIAPVAGKYDRLPPCDGAVPLAMFEVHGTADPVAPYGGVSSYVQGWVARDGCQGSPLRRKLDKRHVRFDWTSCDPGTRVAHLRIKGGPHEWPGATATRKPPHGPTSASWMVWRFFAHLRRALTSH